MFLKLRTFSWSAHYAGGDWNCIDGAGTSTFCTGDAGFGVFCTNGAMPGGPILIFGGSAGDTLIRANSAITFDIFIGEADVLGVIPGGPVYTDE